MKLYACPCGCVDSEVIDTRDMEEYRRRRRVCKGCGERFSTLEMTVEAYEAVELRVREKLRLELLRLLE